MNDCYELQATALLRNKKLSLDDLPEDKRTEWICAIAVRYQDGALAYVPQDSRTELFWREVLKNNGTPELCLAAVLQDSSFFDFIPDDKKTPEARVVVLKKHIEKWQERRNEIEKSRYYSYSSDWRRNELNALHQQVVQFLKSVPDSAKSTEFYTILVDYDINFFGEVPDSQKTPELCFTVVKADVNFFQQVPDDKKTSEMCLFAVGKDKNLFKYVPDTLKTSELCRDMVKQSADFLKEVPDDKKTPEMCFMAVQQKGILLEYAPETMRTADVCNSALDNDPEAIKFVPEILQTEDFLLDRVQKDPRILSSLGNKPSAFWLALVRKNGIFLAQVPETHRRGELCVEALKNANEQAGKVFSDVPDEIKTPDFLLEIMQINGKLLQYVPEKKRTNKICLAAVKNENTAFEFVPENLQDYIQEQIPHG